MMVTGGMQKPSHLFVAGITDDNEQIELHRYSFDKNHLDMIVTIDGSDLIGLYEFNNKIYMVVSDPNTDGVIIVTSLHIAHKNRLERRICVLSEIPATKIQ